MHASVLRGCHFGINATQKKVSERCWWSTMTEDMRHLVRTHIRCRGHSSTLQPSATNPERRQAREALSGTLRCGRSHGQWCIPAYTVNGSPIKVTANSRDLMLFTSDGYASPHKATIPQVDRMQSSQD